MTVWLRSCDTAALQAAVSYSTEAQSFFARLATQPTNTRKTQYNTLISSLVSAGVWTKLDALWVMAAADAATAQTNLLSSSYGLSPGNAPAFTADQGYNGSLAGQQYLSTGYNASLGGVNYTQDSGHLGVWSLTDVGSNGKSEMAFDNGTTTPASFLNPRNASNSVAFAINSTFSTTANASSVGHCMASRTASNLTTPYVNGVAGTAAATASVALTSTPLILLNSSLTSNAGGVSLQASGRIVSAAHIGAGLNGAEVTAFYNALHSYMQAVAGAA